jgi:hypothetical protein
VQRLGPAFLHVRENSLPQPGRRRRAQLEVGERRLEVETRAPDDDRAPARLERRVDLRVRERGELTRGEGLGHGDERQQAVLEPLPLRRCGRAGEDLEAAVDLESVGGNGHGVLPALAQAVGELDRRGRLPHAGRAEDRDDAFRNGHDR